ncbi:MAG: hypothetical protein IKA87_06975 [Lentisphaeria bacterium]|nr:hypothetical protein [Lentisphaeria bacterium]
MRKVINFFLLLMLLITAGCTTSSLKWSPAGEGETSLSGKKAVWKLNAVNNGLYLFYYIPFFCGSPTRPNRWDYKFFRHCTGEKHALMLLNSKNRQLKADAVEDVKIKYNTNGWIGLGILWSRSFSASGIAVKSKKNR